MLASCASRSCTLRATSTLLTRSPPPPEPPLGGPEADTHDGLPVCSPSWPPEDLLSLPRRDVPARPRMSSQVGLPVMGTVAFRKAHELIAQWRSIDTAVYSTFILAENGLSAEVSLAVAEHIKGSCQDRPVPVWLEAPENPSPHANATQLQVCAARHPLVREVHVLQWARNEGCAVAWNAILRHGFGLGAPYVIVANDDVSFSPWALHAFHSAVMQRLLKDRVPSSNLYPALRASMPNKQSGRHSGGNWSLFAFSRGVVERAGYFDENIFPPYYEDDDMTIRLALLGVPDLRVREASFVHAAKHTGHDQLPAADMEMLRAMGRRACTAVYLARKWRLHVKHDSRGWGRFYQDDSQPRPGAAAEDWAWLEFQRGGVPYRAWPKATRQSVLATAVERWRPVDLDRQQYIRSGGGDVCYHCLSGATAPSPPWMGAVCRELSAPPAPEGSARGTAGLTREYRCYVQRYADLLRAYCDGKLASCNWRKVARHWERSGRAEGRSKGCNQATGARSTAETVLAAASRAVAAIARLPSRAASALGGAAASAAAPQPANLRPQASSHGSTANPPVRVGGVLQREYTCYVQRHKDLLHAYCNGDLALCNWRKVARHWDDRGRAEGRQKECLNSPFVYREGQYEAACKSLAGAANATGECPSDCSALGTPGSVCPMVLACEAVSGAEASKAPRGNVACTTARLPGLGFNPSIIHAPTWIREQHGWSAVRARGLRAVLLRQGRVHDMSWYFHRHATWPPNGTKSSTIVSRAATGARRQVRNLHSPLRPSCPPSRVLTAWWRSTRCVTDATTSEGGGARTTCRPRG